MINNIFYILNYPALFLGILTCVSLIFSVIFKVRVDIKYIKIGLLLLIFAIAVVSFNYEPSIYTDLYRYYNTLNIMRETGGAYYNSQEIVSNLIFTMVAKTNYNNLLPFITSTIRFSVFVYVLLIYVKKEKHPTYSVKMFLIFNLAFFPIIESISGVRYYFAITLVFAGLLHGLKYSQKIHEIIYSILALLIHTSSIIYIGLRFLVIERVYKVIKPFRFLIVFWPLGITQMAKLLLKVNSSITYSAANMLIFYSEERRNISIRLTLARISILIVLILMFYILKKKDFDCYKRSEDYYKYLELVFLFTLGSIQYAVFFQRNIFFLALICMPLIMDVFSSVNIGKRLKMVYSTCIVILSLGMIANQIYGIMTGYF